MNNKPFVVALMSAVVVGGVLGGVFAGGVVYGKGLAPAAPKTSTLTPTLGTNAQASPTAPAGGSQGAGLGVRLGGSTGAQGSGGIAGTIEKIEGDVVTITTAQGTVQAKLDATTTYQKVLTSTGALADVQPGTRVQVVGQRAEDGTVTARMVIVTAGDIPMMGRQGAQGRQSGSQTQTQP